MSTEEAPKMTLEEAVAALNEHGNIYLTESWAEHLTQGLAITREALLGDLSGDCGQEFAESTKRFLMAHTNVFARATAAEKPLDFHLILGEMHTTCAEAWQEKEPHESDFVKLAHAVAINTLPGMAFIASMLIPGYELRLVKVDQPAAPAEQSS